MSDFPFSIPRRGDADVVNGVSYAGDTLTLTRAEGSDLTTTIATSDPTKIENGTSSMEIASAAGDCVFTPAGDAGLATTFAADGNISTAGDITLTKSSPKIVNTAGELDIQSEYNIEFLTDTNGNNGGAEYKFNARRSDGATPVTILSLAGSTGNATFEGAMTAASFSCGSTKTVVSPAEIFYNGSTGGGTANGISFKWNGSNIIGRVDNTTDINLAAISDRRVKRNIESITNEKSRKFLDVIKPRSYNQAAYEKNGLVISADRDEIMYGGVAQEIEEDFPEVVYSAQNDELKSLYSERILFLTISSLQLVDKNVRDLQTTIEKLKERLAVLENK